MVKNKSATVSMERRLVLTAVLYVVCRTVLLGTADETKSFVAGDLARVSAVPSSLFL